MTIEFTLFGRVESRLEGMDNMDLLRNTLKTSRKQAKNATALVVERDLIFLPSSISLLPIIRSV